MLKIIMQNLFPFQRPAADDVFVLKQELVSVQTLMDRMTQDREKEKDELESEKNNIEKAYQQLKTQCHIY